jgi:DNA-binding response OmpR family regulator
MTERIAAGRELNPAPAPGTAQLRVAVLDTDTGFLQVLGKRLERLGWEHRVLASPVPTDAIVAMRLNAIVIDLTVLGPQAWDYLEKLCASLPGLGVVVCTGQSTVAQRVRGLRMGADDWLTKPCHPEELLARVEAVVRRRRRAEAREERAPISAGEVEIRADRFQAYVGGTSVDLTRREFELIELLAAAVYFIPGGGNAANLIGALLSTAILASFVMLAARFYRERRMDILGLPDKWRATLYGALGVIVLAMAARPRLIETGGGTILWLFAVAGSGYALYRVWRYYREYA